MINVFLIAWLIQLFNSSFAIDRLDWLLWLIALIDQLDQFDMFLWSIALINHLDCSCNWYCSHAIGIALNRFHGTVANDMIRQKHVSIFAVKHPIMTTAMVSESIGANLFYIDLWRASWLYSKDQQFNVFEHSCATKLLHLCVIKAARQLACSSDHHHNWNYLFISIVATKSHQRDDHHNQAEP